MLSFLLPIEYVINIEKRGHMHITAHKVLYMIGAHLIIFCSENNNKASWHCALYCHNWALVESNTKITF